MLGLFGIALIRVLHYSPTVAMVHDYRCNILCGQRWICGRIEPTLAAGRRMAAIETVIAQPGETNRLSESDRIANLLSEVLCLNRS